MTRATRAGLIKFALLTGAADSATAGITTAAQDGTAINSGDIIIGCINLTQTTNAWVDVTSDAVIIAGGKITVPESANDVIAVWWMATNAGLQVASPFIASEVGAGALAETNITITGIAENDIIISAVEINATSGAWTDRTATTSITAANTVQCSASTNGHTLKVIYMSLSAVRAFSALNVQFGIGTIDASPSDTDSTITLTGVNAEDVLFSVVAVDETDYDIIDDLTAYCVVSAGDVLTFSNEPSETATSGSKVLCFYQKTNDLAT